MAENEDSQEKTEEPTARRREKAREEGRILTSKDMNVFASMAAGLGLLAASGLVLPALAARWAHYFVLTGPDTLDTLIDTRLGDAWLEILLASIGVALPLAGAVLLVQAATGGIVFSGKALGFKPDKIDPIAGLGRMFSSRALAELGKGVVKVTVLGAAGWWSLKDQLPILARLNDQTAASGVAVVGTALFHLMTVMVVALAVIGAIDLAWQRHSLMKSLRMTKQEMKDELKESEGSPEMKGHIRKQQMAAARDGAKRRAALDRVPEATAVITNPTHFAVALRYVPGETPAPVILALGRGPMALEIIARARLAHVTALQSPLLARALYFTGDIGQEISAELYAAVAAVLAHVYRLDQGEAPEMPEIHLPDALQLDEHGRPLNGDADV